MPKLHYLALLLALLLGACLAAPGDSRADPTTPPPSGEISPETLAAPTQAGPAPLLAISPEALLTGTGQAQDGLPTPTLFMVDVPPSATPVIHTATLAPVATSLAAVPRPFSPTGSPLPSYSLMAHLIGRPVRGPEGHNLGLLTGLVIARSDPVGPQVRYALLETAPDVGLPAGQNLVYVPWPMAAISRDPLDNSAYLVLMTEPAQLAAAPAYNPAALPAVDQPGWDAPLVAYWSQHAASLPVTGAPRPTRTPTPPPTPTATAIAATTPDPASTQFAAPTQTAPPQPAAAGTPLLVRGKLADLRLIDAGGDPAGSVEDFLLHPQNGQIAFVVVEFEGRLVPVPLAQMGWRTLPEDGAAGVLQLIYPDEMLINAPAFGSLEEIEAAAPGWDEAAAAYWESSP